MTADITLYGASWCAPCKKAKAVIDSTRPGDYGATFAYVEVQDGSETTVPLTVIGGEHVPGFNEEMLRSKLSSFYASLSTSTTLPEIEIWGDVPEDEPDDPPKDNQMNELGIMLSFAAIGYVLYQMLNPED